MTGRLGYVRPISVNPAAANMANVPVNRADPLTRVVASLSTSTGVTFNGSCTVITRL